MPFLSLRVVEKHSENAIFNPVEMHLLWHFEGLVTRLCIVAVGGKVWKQKGPVMVSLNDWKFVWKQLRKFPIRCCPGNFDVHCLLFDYSYWVYILLSNVFSSLWYNPKFPSGFRLNVCSGFLPCLPNKWEPLTRNTQPFLDVSENMVRSRGTIDRDFPL